MTEQELKKLSDTEKCKHVVETYFHNKGFSSKDVAKKLNELLPTCHYSPIEAYAWLCAIYGKPNGN